MKISSATKETPSMSVINIANNGVITIDLNTQTTGIESGSNPSIEISKSTNSSNTALNVNQGEITVSLPSDDPPVIKISSIDTTRHKQATNFRKELSEGALVLLLFFSILASCIISFWATYAITSSSRVECLSNPVLGVPYGPLPGLGSNGVKTSVPPVLQSQAQAPVNNQIQNKVERTNSVPMEPTGTKDIGKESITPTPFTNQPAPQAQREKPIKDKEDIRRPHSEPDRDHRIEWVIEGSDEPLQVTVSTASRGFLTYDDVRSLIQDVLGSKGLSGGILKVKGGKKDE